MKYIFNDLANIKKKIKKSNFALLLDFDLTLSPLAQNPNNAFLPKTAKENLKKIALRIPIVIVTGRKLNDIKKRVNVKNIFYIGNHGFEHNLNKKYEAVFPSASMKKAILKEKKELMRKLKMYPGVVVEDKKYIFAVGYRMVQKDKVRLLETIFRKIKKDVEKKGMLKTRLDKKTFELFPAMEVNKGTACLLALKIIQKKLRKELTPVYIGDGQTDEYAFSALKKTGITIRVGRRNKSSAKWYLRNQKEVNSFLEWLLSILD